MYNFFSEHAKNSDGEYFIYGSDFNHIKNVLRLKVGEQILISFEGKSDLCQITAFALEHVIAKVIKEDALDSSLPIKITLFQ